MTPIIAVTFSGLVTVLLVRAAFHGAPTAVAPSSTRSAPFVAVQTASDSADLDHPGVLNAEQALNLVVRSLVGERSFERQFSGFGPPTHDFPGKTNVVFNPAKQTLAVNVLQGVDASADSLGWEVDAKAGTLTMAKDAEDPKADTAYHFVSGAIKNGKATIHFEIHQRDPANNSTSGPLIVTITRSRQEFDLQLQTAAHGAKPTKGEMKFIFTRPGTTP